MNVSVVIANPRTINVTPIGSGAIPQISIPLKPRIVISMIGLPGPPGPQGEVGSDVTFLFVQNLASTDWVVDHNLGKFPSITIVDSAGTEVEGDVEHISMDQALIHFSYAISGSVYCN